MHVRKFLAAVGDGDFAAVFFDLQEGDRLVVRPFGVQLQLAVLVGYATPWWASGRS
jgi:hypothetical protein